MRGDRGAAGRIRIRRLGPTRFLGRKRYEVELPAIATGDPFHRKVTSVPVTMLEKHLGVGDAWSLVKAADAAWDGQTGKWVSLYEQRVICDPY